MRDLLNPLKLVQPLRPFDGEKEALSLRVTQSI